MRRLLFVILAAALLAACARLFWLKEIVESPDLAQQMWLAAAIVGLTIVVLGLKQMPAAKKPRAIPAKPARPLPRETPTDALDSIIADFETITGEAERPPAMAAWGLHLHAPFAPARAATSWFGGVPVAPEGFDWPCDADGQRLHFAAQIDLAALTPVPGLGGPPAGLPGEGELLVFIGAGHSDGGGYACRILSPAEVESGQNCAVPDDLAPLSDLGFWIDSPTFERWPLDLVGFADDGRERPGPPERPVTTWGLATYDLTRVATALRTDAAMRERHDKWIETHDPATPLPATVAKEAEHHAVMRVEGPPLMAAVDAFLARAEAQDPKEPADAQALAEITARRTALSGRLVHGYPVKLALRPNPAALAAALIASHRHNGFRDMPEAYRAFAQPYITGWRGHRLFGKGLPPTTDPQDLQGLDCLISILSDPILQTQTEHGNGFSIWCDRDAMAEGDFSEGRLVLHTNV